MTASPRLLILFHASCSEEQLAKYRIVHLARRWKRAGYAVRFQRGLGGDLDADVLIPQIDLTVMPEPYRVAIAAARSAVNASVLDVRRRSYSRQLLEPGAAYAGPVIVKTDRNFGGIPEAAAAASGSRPARFWIRLKTNLRSLRAAAAARSHAPLAYTNTIPPEQYPVYPSLRDVPLYVFRNPHLVVEQFLPERVGDHYYLRSYAFLCDRGITVRTRANTPVVKGKGGTHLEFVENDPTIVERVRELKFDYGKFDYTVHEGRAVLFDANPSPTFGEAYGEDARQRIAAHLAEAIRHWAKSPARHG